MQSVERERAYMFYLGKIKEKTGIGEVMSANHVPIDSIMSKLIWFTEDPSKVKFIKLSKQTLPNSLKELAFNVHYTMFLVLY